MKRFLLFMMMSVCALTGAWAETVMIQTVDSKTTITITDNGSEEVTFADGCESLPGTFTNTVITGPISSRVFNAISSKGGWNTQATAKLDLSGTTGITSASDLSTALCGINYGYWMRGITVIILPTGCDTPDNTLTRNNVTGFDEWDALNYFVIPNSNGSCTVVVTNQVNSIDLNDLVTTNNTVQIIALNDDQNPPTESNISSIETQLTNNSYTVINTATMGTISEAAQDDDSAIETKIALADSYGVNVTSVTVTSGTVGDKDMTAIAGISNDFTLDISGANVSDDQLWTLLNNSHITTLTLSDSQKSQLKALSGKTFTTDLVSKLGLTAAELADGMTGDNYIIDGATLYATGKLTEARLAEIKTTIAGNSSITALNVLNCTADAEINITDEKIGNTGSPKQVTLVSVPGGNITYSGDAISILNGVLTISLGTSGQYANVAAMKTALGSLLDDVEHLKLTGTLTAEDIDALFVTNSTSDAINICGSATIKTLDLSEATKLDNSVWQSKTKDTPCEAAVLLPQGTDFSSYDTWRGWGTNFFAVNAAPSTQLNIVVGYAGSSIEGRPLKNGNYFAENIEGITSLKIFNGKSGSGAAGATALNAYKDYTGDVTLVDLSGAQANTSEGVAEATAELAVSKTVISPVSTSSTLAVSGKLTNEILATISSLSSSITSIDFSGVTSVESDVDWATLTGPSSVEYILMPSAAYAEVGKLDKTKLTALKGAGTTNGTDGYIHIYEEETAANTGAIGKFSATFTKNYILPFGTEVTKFIVSTSDGVALNAESAKLGTYATAARAYDLSNATFNNLTSIAVAGSNTDLSYIIAPANTDKATLYTYANSAYNLGYVYSINGTTADVAVINGKEYGATALTAERIGTAVTTVNLYGQNNQVTAANVATIINNAAANVTTVNVKLDQLSNATGDGANMAVNNANLTNLTIATGETSTSNWAVSVAETNNNFTLDVNHQQLASITSANSHLTAIDLSGTAVSGATTLAGTGLTTSGFTTTDETTFGGNLDLSTTQLTSFSTEAKVSGDITLNAISSLTKIDVRQTAFQNTTSKIHIHKTANEEDTNVIDNLLATDDDGVTAETTIFVPEEFTYATRIHPYTEATLQAHIKEVKPIAPSVTFAETYMHLHETEAAENGDKLVYWYEDALVANGFATITLRKSDDSNYQTLKEIIEASENNLDEAYVKVKIVGTLTATDLSQLKNLNATVLDLSEAVITGGETTLATALASSDALHANTKFLVAPNGSTRDGLLNKEKLKNLGNLYTAVAYEENNTAQRFSSSSTGELTAYDLGNGYNLTSYTAVAGTLQAAVVAAMNSATGEYKRKVSGENKLVYLSNISTFRDLQISGEVNAYDLCNTTTVDAYGHIERTDNTGETAINPSPAALAGTQVYGPFSSCYEITTIDLRDAWFQREKDGSGNVTKDYVADMTLSSLNILGSATSKVVIPQTETVEDLPADFMNANTVIRSICIPSNIKRIHSRAFYTIDYVWTTANEGDPEGSNTKLDNGVYLNGKQYFATDTDPETGKKYEDIPGFLVRVAGGKTGGGSYTFGSNLDLIETAAFANTEPNVRDVYVLNTIAPECHVDAFNTIMYNGNGGYNPVGEGEKIITRDNYYNGHWITMLHYPRQTTTPNVQRYTDPTREYSIATGERDGKGATLYYPNQSEFIRAYAQGTYGYTWNAWDPTRDNNSVTYGDFNATGGHDPQGQTKANTLFTNNMAVATDKKKWYNFYDLTEGGTLSDAATTTAVLYSNIYWNESDYATSGTENQHLYPAGKDYRGWHQFVLNAYAANTVLDEEPYRSYITDTDWWTICMPFDLTREEAILFFGNPNGATDAAKIPYVSKLQYVTRNYTTATITLNFSKNLMVNKEDRSDATAQHGDNDANGVLKISEGTVPAASDLVMAAGVPYLIKPNFVESIRQFRIYKTEEDKTKMEGATSAEDRAKFKTIVSSTLYDKMHNVLGGEAQMALIHNGKYTVPVFVSGTNTTLVKEDNSGSYTIAGNSYSKSDAWQYTFVGTFYKSVMPQYAYYLGWDSANSRAAFFYNGTTNYEKYKDVYTWVNETGIICPTPGAFNYTITPAAGKDPAAWKINAQLTDDSFTKAGGGSGSAKSTTMFFGAEDVVAVGVATGIAEIDTDSSLLTEDSPVKVYTLNGQLAGNSLRGLQKGIYVVNGKKLVVK